MTLITLDGSDGTGKQTQTKLLIDRLKKEGHEVETMDFPQYEHPSSLLVRAYLGKNPFNKPQFGPPNEVDPKVASEFYAIDRMYHAPKINNWLEKGKIVVLDRYVSANKGHQGGKFSDKNKLHQYLSWLDHLEYDVNRIPKEDLNIILYLSPSTAQQLIEKRGEKLDGHETSITHIKNTARSFKYMTNLYSHWNLIECETGLTDKPIKTREAIHEKIYSLVKRLF